MLSGVMLIMAVYLQPDTATVPQQEAPTNTTVPSATPTETIPPSTPLATLTPSNTLRPPPTFEPPTVQPTQTLIPSETPSPTFIISVDLQDVHGLETPTPSTTPGCNVNREWTNFYEVQPNDALETIAQRYNVSVWDLSSANCLTDANVIYIGQRLRVPGPPPVDVIECVVWEGLTPMNGAFDIDPDGQLTFNWRGPVSPRNLVRIYNSDGEVAHHVVVDMRQNATINLREDLPDEGHYTWYVYPLDMGFAQIDCLEGGPWRFHKDASTTMP